VRVTSSLWSGIDDIYASILRHPFLTGLTDGSLPPSAFAFYVVQDALYLRQYAQSLALVAARAPAPEWTEMFARHAAEAISVERSLHSSLLPELGIDPAVAAAVGPAPVTLAYTSYLLSVTALESFADGVGAVLPCYWIYWEVGKELLRLGSPDPRYQRWISTYGGEDFGAVVQEVLDVTDEVASTAGPAELDRLRHHFRTTSRYEWMFWDMAYRQEHWPV
jgi:thiaminase (transcriptional activator TenA)